jgi:hypothetical protein
MNDHGSTKCLLGFTMIQVGWLGLGPLSYDFLREFSQLPRSPGLFVVSCLRMHGRLQHSFGALWGQYRGDRLLFVFTGKKFLVL